MRARIKVLWLIKGLGPGGAERLLVSAARVGDHERFCYSAAYVLPHKNALVPDLHRCGVPTHCLTTPETRSWWTALRRHLLATHYDVVHVHSPLLAGATRLLVLTLPKAHRPALVSTEHNSWASYSPATRLLNASLHSRDRHRWAVSPQVRESVWAPLRSGVEVLVHGIVAGDADTDVDRSQIRTELGIADNDIVAVTVGNFRPQKAYPDLLRAAATAMKAEPRLRLLVVGQGPLEQEVHRYRDELGLGDRCLMLGYREHVMPILKASDLFVLASHVEGFPVALMEAMAAGLPVVATSVGGIPEAVTHGREGLLAAPGDVEAIAAHLLRMASDDELRLELARRAHARGGLFDITSAVRRMEQAYAQLVDSPGSPTGS